LGKTFTGCRNAYLMFSSETPCLRALSLISMSAAQL